jgi:hypothetical protein
VEHEPTRSAASEARAASHHPADTNHKTFPITEPAPVLSAGRGFEARRPLSSYRPRTKSAACLTRLTDSHPRGFGSIMSSRAVSRLPRPQSMMRSRSGWGVFGPNAWVVASR